MPHPILSVEVHARTDGQLWIEVCVDGDYPVAQVLDGRTENALYNALRYIDRIPGGNPGPCENWWAKATRRDGFVTPSAPAVPRDGQVRR